MSVKHFANNSALSCKIAKFYIKSVMLLNKIMFPYAVHKEYVMVSICSTSYINYRIQAFMAKLNCFRTCFW